VRDKQKKYFLVDAEKLADDVSSFELFRIDGFMTME
jgi:hypothetical protein